MKQMSLKNMWRILVSCALALTMIINAGLSAHAVDTRNPFNAVSVTVDSTNEEGSIENGTELWYKFVVPNNGNNWLIVRVTTFNDTGTLNFEVKGAQLNTIKGAYSLGGNQVSQLVFKIGGMNIGVDEEFLPRLIVGATYYVRIYGKGDFNLNIDSYADDYNGDYSSATTLTAGTPINGTIERMDDIDAFKYKPPTGNSYLITVSATRKMDVKITDKDDYVIDNSSLRVLRDRATSEYAVSGISEKRYYFLTGLTGTGYNISVKAVPKNQDNTLGSLAKVRAFTGQSFIKVKTQKGAKVLIQVMKGSGNKALKVKGKKILKVTQKKNSATYRLNRQLRPRDVIRVTVTKGRLKSYVFYKKMTK